jgi:hypothetical protein
MAVSQENLAQEEQNKSTLSDSLGTDMNTFASKLQYGGPRQLEGDLKLIGSERARVMGEESKSNQRLADLQAQQKLIEIQGKKEGVHTARQRTTDIQNDLEATQKKFPLPEFHPTQENVQELAGLFSLIGVIGMGMGGQGRLSAIGAKKSMAGMMNGWQKGDEQKFLREKSEFDTEFRRIKAIRDEAGAKAEQSMKMVAYDREEAEILAAESAALMGSQIGRAMVAKGDLERYYNYLGDLEKNIDKTYDRYVTVANANSARDINKPVKIQLKDGTSVYGGYAEHKNQYVGADGKQIDPNSIKDVEVVGVPRQELNKASKIFFKDGTFVYGSYAEHSGEYRGPNGEQIDPSSIREVEFVGTPRAGGGSSGANLRTLQAQTQVVDALDNLTNLPVTTTAPVFGSKNFDGLFTAPLGYLNQTLSSETAQKMATRMAGVSRSLATLESGGAATGLLALTKSIEEGVEIKSGAKLRVALDKLAEMRRIFDSSARTALASDKFSDSDKELIRQNMDIVAKAIPFTQKDLDAAERAGSGISNTVSKADKNLSFSEYLNKYAKNSKFVVGSIYFDGTHRARYDGNNQWTEVGPQQ